MAHLLLNRHPNNRTQARNRLEVTTQESTTNCYRNLKDGMGSGEALRRVQLEMLKRNRRLHPFYWANFIHSGEWASLDGKW